MTVPDRKVGTELGLQTILLAISESRKTYAGQVTDDCIICLKHRGEGPLTGQLIARIGGFEIWSARTDEEGRAPLGYLFIESEQHVPYVADLGDDDAAALGLLRTRLARALRDVLGA